MNVVTLRGSEAALELSARLTVTESRLTKRGKEASGSPYKRLLDLAVYALESGKRTCTFVLPRAMARYPLKSDNYQNMQLENGTNY